MSRTVKRLGRVSMSLTVGLLAGTCAFAEDIQIYVGLNQGQSVAKPNVLFILDTSGSMAEEVTTTTPFDPAQTYAGDCASNKIFWSTDGDAEDTDCDTDRWFDATKFRCQAAAGPLGAGGVGTDRLAFWQPRSNASKSKWERLDSDVQDPPHVECQADQGVHGSGSGGTFAANSTSGPWKSSGPGLDWSATGRTYTIFSANYLNWFHFHSQTTIGTRIQIMKDVVKSVVDSNTNINIGLMRYDTRIYNTPPSGNKGGPVIFPMSNIDAPGVRDNFKSQVDGLTAGGWTPLSETLYEAYRYLAGQGVVYGKAPNNIPSVPECLDPSGKYKSPMEFECQKNFIVYLTDGEPTYDRDADSAIGSLLSGATLPSGDRTCAHGTSELPQDNCLDELAEYLHEKDLRSDLNGKQNAVSYMIGFTLDFPQLRDAATKGGGRYFTANTAQELSSAFTQIVTEIRTISDTFTAPAVSVNAFNRLFHRDELYFAVFRPDADIRWPGNLKRYKIGIDNGEFAILDKGGNPAVDPNTGFFSDSSRSFWTDDSDPPDGDAPEKGGAAGELDTPDTRKLYTYTGNYATTGVNVLSDAANLLADDNQALTNAMLGIPATDRTNLIQWARGVDVDDEDADGDHAEARRDMGDPLHSNPVLVTYGGDEDVPDITVFVTTNDGYLHAINAGNGTNGGEEIFAFVPQEMLGRLKDLMDDPPIPGAGRDYGLDGPMTVWVKENPEDDDATIEPGEGDHVYLYFGQRRGGRNYYALDVTNRTAPKLMWRIKGGEGDFAELSETWSGPKRTRVQLGEDPDTQTDVLIFGGGFDPDQETSTVPGPDSQGRAIYMVDAVTGQRLWWAGYNDPASAPAPPDLAFDDMTNSIPANVRVIDLDRDGLADRMYAADMGGRLWRFDINNGPADGEPLVSGTLMAEFQRATATGADPTIEADNRRFFNEPDAALIVPPGTPAFMSVAIGSGNRSHPLNKVTQDRFYMVRDPNPLSKPVNASGGDAYPTQWPLQEDDMFNVTDVIDFSDTQQAALDGGPGWMIHLPDAGAFVGEKALTEAVTFNGVVLFATFTPVATASTNACSPSQGTGRVYAVNVLNGNPVFNLDQAGDPNDLTRTDRSLNLVRTGLPPDIEILFPQPDPNNPGSEGPVALAGPEVLNELNLNNPIVKTYWYADDDNAY